MDENDFTHTIGEAIDIVEKRYIDDIKAEYENENLTYSEAKDELPYNLYNIMEDLFDHEWKECIENDKVIKSLNLLKNIDSNIFDIVSIRCWISDPNVDFGGIFDSLPAAATVTVPYNDNILVNVYINGIYEKFLDYKEITTLLYHEGKHIELISNSIKTKTIKEYNIMRLFHLDEKLIDDEIKKTILKDTYDTMLDKFDDVLKYRYENRKILIQRKTYIPFFELHTALTGITI